MRLTKIELNNFGSYYGKNSLSIDISDDQKQIVLIGGENGAGKTTLFTAIILCLYGHYSFGYKNSGKVYTQKVFTYINDTAKLDEDESAYVTLDFVDSSNGDLDSYSITRSWIWKKSNVKESIVAQKNGQVLEKQSLADFQNFLLNMIPPSLLKLYFFDGERIAEYLLDDAQNNVRDALMILSGNDTFDIMYSGIKKVLVAGNAAEDTATREYFMRKSEKISLDESRKALKESIDNLNAQIEDKKAEVDRVKKEYAAQGGISLDEWKDLNSKLKAEDEARERINFERKEIATDILPFVIVSSLLEKVRPQITKEHEYKTWQTLSQTLTSDRFRNIIADTLSKTGQSGFDEITSQICDNIVTYLVPVNGWNSFDPIFGLSEDDEMDVQAIINRVSQFNVTRIAELKAEHDSSLGRSQEFRDKLQNSSIDNYQEYVKSLSDLNEEIFQLTVLLNSKQDELANVEVQYQAAEKKLGEAYKNLELDIKRKSVTSISSRAIVLLEELQTKIHGKLNKEVRADTLSALKLLIRKKSFIEDLVIDDNFKVHLLKYQIIEIKDILKIHNRSGVEGVKRSLQKYGFESLCKIINAPETAKDLTTYLHSYTKPTVNVLMEISVDSLSKGEKQIFVMSLYWAMMRQSKCQLPFIIDTPFARIDSEHRSNIVDYFFKRLPGQLLILSTNEEINAKHMQTMSDSISNSFMLEFGEDKRTRVVENRYFEV